MGWAKRHARAHRPKAPKLALHARIARACVVALSRAPADAAACVHAKLPSIRQFRPFFFSRQNSSRFPAAAKTASAAAACHATSAQGLQRHTPLLLITAPIAVLGPAGGGAGGVRGQAKRAQRNVCAAARLAGRSGRAEPPRRLAGADDDVVQRTSVLPQVDRAAPEGGRAPHEELVAVRRAVHEAVKVVAAHYHVRVR